MPRTATSGKAPGFSSQKFRRPAPSYRHGTPSSPWPFLDAGDEVDEQRLRNPEDHRPFLARPCVHNNTATPSQENPCWCKYPQSKYPNWTPAQQQKSRIWPYLLQAKHQRWKAYYVDVQEDGVFMPTASKHVSESVRSQNSQWGFMTEKRPQQSRARVVFIDSWAGYAMQMFGTRYNIEPFFFSSTINRIPSRFQSNIEPEKGDQITLTLTFMRSIPCPTGGGMAQDHSTNSTASLEEHSTLLLHPPRHVIDTQAPLLLNSPSAKFRLISDFLAVHMVRQRADSTIISLHEGTQDSTTAEVMHERFHLCSKSVYWSSIFKATGDPTCLLLCFL
ncbi:hypothetical protein BKA70DRAFT_236118 [Coprinopsis sp. MPI-PUGE-AT-0042]|nr:hypothetical protein BKA70DRAFT_236118 [Coprinopsis sp. MPI-PUGE-AT-0042]